MSKGDKVVKILTKVYGIAWAISIVFLVFMSIAKALEITCMSWGMIVLPVLLCMGVGVLLAVGLWAYLAYKVKW
jgi:hypothetical protein